MDVTVVPLELHPNAENFLFEHFVAVRKIFSDVIGQLETDYLSITLINPQQQVFFFSSNPSVQQNLIEEHAWSSHGVYQPEFINQEHPRLWNELNNGSAAAIIQKCKQAHGLIAGIAIPTHYNDYQVALSFGFKKVNRLTQNKTPFHCKQLLGLGQYCLREFNERLLFPDKLSKRPHLQLVTNNKA